MTTPKMNENLSAIFDIELAQTDKPLVELRLDATASSIDSLEKQREYVKANMVKLIERGMNAVGDLNIIANSSEKSRDFEVLGNMIKTLIDSNIELLNIEVMHKPQEVATEQKAGTINNNTVFVGSTKDLSEYRKSQKANNILDV